MHAQGINYNNLAAKGINDVTFMTARLGTTASESALLLHIKLLSCDGFEMEL